MTLFYLVGMLPIVYFLIMILVMDALVITNLKTTVACLIWGAACCFVQFEILNRTDIDLAWSNILLEEVVKISLIAFLVGMGRIVFLNQALTYGFAAGAGFALVENMIYITYVEDISLMESIIRGFSTSLLHMCCTSLCACCLLLSLKITWKKPVYIKVLATLPTILPSFTIHYIYNTTEFPLAVKMAEVAVLSIVLIHQTFVVNGRLMAKWIDSSLFNDIRLIAAIREGNLRGTYAGRYLMDIGKTLPKEVFFDMCCYVILYIEISVQAKSRLMLREVGLEVPQEDQDKEKARLDEMYSLRKSLGKSRIKLLAPLLPVTAEDTWSIRGMSE